MSACLISTVAFAQKSTNSGPTKSCWTFKPEARFAGLGYNHLVHIDNGCEARLSCKVSTNVHPEVQEVSVEPKAQLTVTTFMGSPSSEFKAIVECKK